MNTISETDLPDAAITSRGMRFPDAPVLTGRPRRLLRMGRYETKEAEAAMRVVKPGDTVLEMGGGVGFMSTLVSKHRKAGKIHVFEANPKLVDYIAQVHAANDVTGAEIHHCLLTPKGGDPLPFYLRENFLGSSMDRDSDPDTITETHMVQQRPVAEAFTQIKPDVLICDIEGAEAEVLPHADLTSLRVAIVELHPQWIGQKGVQAVFDCFARAGLSYFPKVSHAKVVCFRKGW